MFKRAFSFITAAVLSTGLLTADSANKDIVVQARDSGSSSVSYNITIQQNITPAPASSDFSDTIVYARPAKKSYYVGEPIKVQLKLKRDAYIYFWTVSSSGKGYLILPNSFESYNKYRKNIEYVVPERSAKYHFVSDRPGVEKVFILATNKKISRATLEKIFNKRAGGVIPVATNISIRRFINKDIIVISREQSLKYDIATFNIKIKPRPKPRVETQNRTQTIERGGTVINIKIEDRR
jgi:hypothetical protein